LAVVMFTSTLVSAALNEKSDAEEFGRASFCANYWRNAVMTLVADNGHDPNTDLLGNTSYIDIYMVAYTHCLSI